MNVRDTRKIVKQRIDTMSESRLDALMTLLENKSDELLMREDDRAFREYGKVEVAKESDTALNSDEFAKQMKKSLKKRAAARKLVDGLTKTQLAAVATLLEEAGDGYIISEEEWAEIDQRVLDVEEGRVKMVPMDEAMARIRETLRKLKK
jgi:hypothetical protein